MILQAIVLTPDRRTLWTLDIGYSLLDIYPVLMPNTRTTWTFEIVHWILKNEPGGSVSAGLHYYC
ncbi:MAG TPA: hypothetical protein DCF33_03100 [Saprospirales bacterium]|nr:hypothetical protein [Saprospirales bacterium]